MSTILIHNGTLIDGRGGPPLRDAFVLIDGDLISAVGSGDALPTSTQADRKLDAQGGSILPGFIDAHVHLMLEGLNLAKAMATPFSLRFYDSVTHMRRTLEAGVTSVRDAGGADAGLKQAVDTGVVMGPRVQISIAILTTTGGHLDFWMRSGNDFKPFPAYPGFPDGICDGVEEVRKKVREVLRAGAEVVKICATGGVLSPTDHPDFTQFSPEEIAVVVQEARFRRGLKVMAHAQGAEGIKNAIRGGVHSIEHGIYLDDEAIALMVERDVYLVPTLLAVNGVIETGPQVGMPEHAIAKAREVAEVHALSIRRAHKAGVKIAMGTDAGVIRHGSNLRELGLMTGVGMSPMEAIVATTRTAAACLGWEDRLGTLEAGKLADVVIARVDPLLDIRSLEEADNIAAVIKGGEVVRDVGGLLEK